MIFSNYPYLIGKAAAFHYPRAEHTAHMQMNQSRPRLPITAPPMQANLKIRLFSQTILLRFPRRPAFAFSPLRSARSHSVLGPNALSAFKYIIC